MLTVLRYPKSSQFTSGCRLATGRSCIAHLIDIYQPKIVFMSCYVPEGVIWPFAKAGVEIKFYRLNRDLSPNVDDVQRLISVARAPFIFVFIHYFGWPGLIDMLLTEAVRDQGGVILEDCAHRLFDESTSEADVTLYSLNKFLPVADGAIMVSRNSAIDITVGDGLRPLSDVTLFAYAAHLEANARIANGFAIGQAMQDNRRAYEIYYDGIKDMKPHGQSNQSRAVEAATNYLGMMTGRKRKSLLLAGLLSRLAGRPHVASQFAFPIRCHGHRREMETALFSADVMASTLTDRWDHVRHDFAIETEFFDDHLLLPIGEDVTNADCYRMAEVLKQFT